MTYILMDLHSTSFKLFFWSDVLNVIVSMVQVSDLAGSVYYWQTSFREPYMMKQCLCSNESSLFPTWTYCSLLYSCLNTRWLRSFLLVHLLSCQFATAKNDMDKSLYINVIPLQEVTIGCLSGKQENLQQLMAACYYSSVIDRDSKSKDYFVLRSYIAKLLFKRLK